MFVIASVCRGLTIFSLVVLVVIVILLWFCLFASAPLGKPFEGVNLGMVASIHVCLFPYILFMFVCISLFLELPSFLALLNGYSILAFQFDIHPMLLTLQIDMQRKSQVYWAAFSGITSEFAAQSFIYYLYASILQNTCKLGRA